MLFTLMSITAELSSLLVICLQLFIDNKWVDAASGKTFPTACPATNKKIADIAEADSVSSILAFVS